MSAGTIVYNGVTAALQSDDEGWIEDWHRKQYVNEEHYPETDYDERQYGGQGDLIVTWIVRVNTEADAAALENSAGATGRTLTLNYDDIDDTAETETWTSVRLDQATRKRRTIHGANVSSLARARWYELELTFSRESP